MSTTSDALAAMMAEVKPEDLMAAIAKLKGAPAAVVADVVTSTPEATKTTTKRTKKAAPVSAAPPLPTVAPVTAVANNGMKVNVTEPYRAMVTFTLNAISVLSKADGRKSTGIHTVFSGFNDAFGKHFTLNREQVYAVIDAMVERRDIERRPAKKGYMLYRPGSMPTGNGRTADDTIALILGSK